MIATGVRTSEGSYANAPCQARRISGRKGPIRRFHIGGRALVALDISREVTLSTIVEMPSLENLRFSRGNVLDKSIPLILGADYPPCRPIRQERVTRGLTARNRREKHPSVDKSRMLACETSCRHRSPRVRDDRERAVPFVLKDRSDSDRYLFCRIRRQT